MPWNEPTKSSARKWMRVRVLLCGELMTLIRDWLNQTNIPLRLRILFKGEILKIWVLFELVKIDWGAEGLALVIKWFIFKYELLVKLVLGIANFTWK